LVDEHAMAVLVGSHRMHVLLIRRGQIQSWKQRTAVKKGILPPGFELRAKRMYHLADTTVESGAILHWRWTTRLQPCDCLFGNSVLHRCGKPGFFGASGNGAPGYAEQQRDSVSFHEA